MRAKDIKQTGAMVAKSTPDASFSENKKAGTLKEQVLMGTLLGVGWGAALLIHIDPERQLLSQRPLMSATHCPSPPSAPVAERTLAYPSRAPGPAGLGIGWGPPF